MRRPPPTLTRQTLGYALTAMLLAGPTFGANKTWSNPGEGSWSAGGAGGNWGGADEPTTNDTAYIQNGGTAVCATGEESGILFLAEAAGGGGTIRLEDPAATLLVINTGNVYWGRRATGVVVQTAGTLMVSNAIQMGYFATGYARYDLSGGTAMIHTCTVGYSSGTGDVFQSGGLLRATAAWNVGRGRHLLTGGTLAMEGILTLSGGLLEMDGAAAVLDFTADTIAYVANGANGALQLTQGTITNAGQLNIGHYLSGVFTLTGGIVKQRPGKSVRMGTYASGEGTLNLLGGTLEIGKYATDYQSLIVGAVASSTGQFNMGNASGCGILTQQVAGAGMMVGNTGTGAFRGWSDDGTGNKLLLTGPLYINKGRITADGYGTDRTLNLAGFSGIFNTADNPLDGTNGWYALNHGALRLPSLAVTGNNTYYWGEQADQDLVNSARLAFTGASGSLTGRLLATNHADVHGLGVIRAVSIHDFTVGGLAACNLALRYDHARATDLGVAETELKLFQWNGSTWSDLSATVNTNTRVISASGLTLMGQFAIGKRFPPSGTMLFFR